MIISLGADHAGYEYKEKLIAYFNQKEIEVIDHGTYSLDSVDYPDFVHPVGRDIDDSIAHFGIVICGSGNGTAMAANKHHAVRCALCWNEELARLARSHNDANVLSIPARFVSFETALKMTETFLNTAFEGGRHQKRIDKIPI